LAAKPTYPQGVFQMSSVAKIIEIQSSSSTSIEDAVENGIKRADSSLDNVEGAWVQDIKCVVKNGKVAEWRVNLKVTFLLKD
jgi:dodecin